MTHAKRMAARREVLRVLDAVQRATDAVVDVGWYALEVPAEEPLRRAERALRVFHNLLGHGWWVPPQ